MFPRLATRETFLWKQENVFESSQEQFCFTDANVVLQFRHGRNITGNNVSATMFPSLAKPKP